MNISEETKQTEEFQDMVRLLREFIAKNSQNNAIPDSFVDQFIVNYLNKDKQFSSDDVYAWFGKQYYGRYDNFIKATIKHCGTCFINSSTMEDLQNEGGKGNKTIYLMSYDAVKLMALKKNHAARIYYLQLEKIVFNFFEHQYKEKLKQITHKLECCKEHIYIYQIDIEQDNQQYVGKTNSVQNRNDSHYYSSSNPIVKQAVQDGKQTKMYILGQLDCYGVDEQRYLEKQFIDNIDTDKKINFKIPQVKDLSNISEEFKQSVQQLIDSNIKIPFDEFIQQSQPDIQNITNVDYNYQTTNIQAHMAYITDLVIDKEFKQKINNIKQYIDIHKTHPKESSKATQDEMTMVRLLQKIRTAYHQNSLKHYQLTPERYSYIKHTIPSLQFEFDKDQDFYYNIDNLKQFVQDNSKMPQYKRQSTGDLEGTLANFVRHIRDYYKAKTLSQERINYIEQEMFNFSWQNDKAKDTVFKTKIQQLKAFMLTNDNKVPDQKQNKKLQQFVVQIRSAYNKTQTYRPIELTQERKDYLLQEIPNFKF